MKWKNGAREQNDRGGPLGGKKIKVVSHQRIATVLDAQPKNMARIHPGMMQASMVKLLDRVRGPCFGAFVAESDVAQLVQQLRKIFQGVLDVKSRAIAA